MERPAKERLIGAIVLVTVAWLLIPVFLDQKDPGSDRTVTRELTLPQPVVEDAGPDAERAAAPLRRETVSLRDDTPAAAEAPATAEVPSLPVPEAALTSESTAANASPPADGGPAATEVERSSVVEPETSEDTQESAVAEAARDEPPAVAASQPEPEPVVETERPAAPATTPATAAPSGAGSSQLWAVQLGSFGDQANAQRLASQLRSDGLPAFLSRIDRDGRALHRVRIGPQATRAEAEAVAARVTASGQSAAVVPHP